MSPNQALIGYSPEFRFAVGDDAIPEGEPTVQQHVKMLELRRKKLEEHWEAAIQRQEKYYN